MFEKKTTTTIVNREPHRDVDRGGGKVELVGGIIAALLMAWLFFELNKKAIQDAIAVVAYWFGVALAIVACGAVVAGLIYAVLWVAYRWQKISLAKAEALSKRREASITLNGEQTYLHDWKNNQVEALHLDPRWRHNSKYTEPSEHELRAWYAFTFKNKPQAAQDFAPQPQPNIVVEPPQLLPVVLKFDRTLLIGGSGSGKTTLMQHIVANKSGDVVVSDPDDDGKTWPGNARVVGGGENWTVIEAELAGFLAEKKRRYIERAQGISNWTPVYLVLEEWYKTLQYIDGGSYLKEFLVSLRKVNMGILVISQSDRASALGLSGNFDLMNSFESVVRLSGTKDTQIKAMIDTGSGPIECAHPGPFYALPSGVTVPQPTYQPIQVEPQDDDGRVLELHGAGHKPWKIGEMVYGSKGGWQTANVEEILRKYGKIQ